MILANIWKHKKDESAIDVHDRTSGGHKNESRIYHQCHLNTLGSLLCTLKQRPVAGPFFSSLLHFVDSISVPMVRVASMSSPLVRRKWVAPPWPMSVSAPVVRVAFAFAFISIFVSGPSWSWMVVPGWLRRIFIPLSLCVCFSLSFPISGSLLLSIHNYILLLALHLCVHLSAVSMFFFCASLGLFGRLSVFVT